jgi:endonuclease III related protein
MANLQQYTSERPLGRNIGSVSLRLADIYRRLFETYGPQHWWSGDAGFEIVAGAILVQQTTWANAQRSLANLRGKAAITPANVAQLNQVCLSELIRPSGCHSLKARALQSVAELLLRLGISSDASFASPVLSRRKLLEAFGIGPETADVILLYAAGQPSFVVDGYTRRIFGRLSLEPDGHAYEEWRSLFMSNLPTDATLFGEFHALIVRHGQQHCRLVPRCSGCTLREICPSRSERTKGTDVQSHPWEGSVVH